MTASLTLTVAESEATCCSPVTGGILTTDEADQLARTLKAWPTRPDSACCRSWPPTQAAKPASANSSGPSASARAPCRTT